MGSAFPVRSCQKLRGRGNSPEADIEKLLLASITVNEDAMRTLALQRGVVVKDYLGSRKLASERLFLGAAKVVTPDADWKPRAELSVTNR